MRATRLYLVISVNIRERHKRDKKCIWFTSMQFGLGASQVQVPWVWQIYLTHITLNLAGRHIHALWTWLVPNLGVLDLANMSHPRYLGLANMPHPYFFGNGLHDFLRGGREWKTLGRSSSVGRLSTHASPLCLGWPNALKVAP